MSAGDWTTETPPPNSGGWFRRVQGDLAVEVIDTGCGAYQIGTGDPDRPFEWCKEYSVPCSAVRS